ncbi:DUF6185 family protein [Streptomyces sp. NPDC002054]|uniref:DUF6185 family protein n=1 Tax=Streptomyces sp. NPDC002054 TaxID=3154663 RepID=UPI00331AC362
MMPQSGNQQPEKPWWRRYRLLPLSLLIIGCLLALLPLITGWWAMSSGVVDAAARDHCQTGLLAARVESAELEFQHRGRMSTQVQSDMTVEVPDTWPYARDLTLGEDSTEYQNAMSCLLRGSEDSLPSAVPGARASVPARHAEWRFHNPKVTAEGDSIAVNYRALAWIDRKGNIRIGPWGIDVDDEVWRVALKPPDALKFVVWRGVKVKLGGLDAAVISPEPMSLKEGVLEWPEPQTLDIAVDVDPPWQRYFTLTSAWQLATTVGVISWWVAASVVMALAAIRALPQAGNAAQEPGRTDTFSRRPAGGRGRGFNEGPKEAVLYWAVLSAAVILTLRMPMKEIASPSWRALIGIAAGLALVLVARPWCRTESPTRQEPGVETVVPPATRRRQALAVTVTATGVAAVGALVIGALHLLGHGSLPTPEAQRLGHLGLVMLWLVTLWLALAAMTAWAWRFVREGELRKSWIKRWDDSPVRWVVGVSVVLAAIAAVILGCFVWAKHRDWKRVAWPGERTGIPDRELRQFLEDFPLLSLRWVYAYSWVLAGIALVALLRIGVEKQRGKGDSGQEISLYPKESDFLLTAAIFAFLVGMRQVEFAGSSAFYGLWFLLIMLSLLAVRKVGLRWSVLSQAGEQFCKQTFSRPERREALLKKAHEYRNWHHQIYLMEHGRADGASREMMEGKLREQERWLSGQGRRRPAEQYSVVDIALAWGPEFHWWDNAKHSARLAFLFGIPASIALAWLTSLSRSQSWLFMLHNSTGLPDLLAKFCAWQIAWAGAGMVLGALWRVLPGRHSPVRALSLTLAYALPVGLGALLSRITDTELGYALLSVLLMLTVLTLTSLWMDMATFHEERQFWPTRFGLLLSIYQMRGLSAQIAYLLAQVAAAVAIWHEVTSGLGAS